jgi:hypothetical protein
MMIRLATDIARIGGQEMLYSFSRKTSREESTQKT